MQKNFTIPLVSYPVWWLLPISQSSFMCSTVVCLLQYVCPWLKGFSVSYKIFFFFFCFVIVHFRISLLYIASKFLYFDFCFVCRWGWFNMIRRNLAVQQQNLPSHWAYKIRKEIKAFEWILWLCTWFPCFNCFLAFFPKVTPFFS